MIFAAMMLFAGVGAQQYSYKTYDNDPLGVREYTLGNGLKVFLSVYKDAPRIQTYTHAKMAPSSSCSFRSSP